MTLERLIWLAMVLYLIAFMRNLEKRLRRVENSGVEPRPKEPNDAN